MGGLPAACLLYKGLAQHTAGDATGATATWAEAKRHVDQSTPLDVTLRILALCDNPDAAQVLRDTDLTLPASVEGATCCRKAPGSTKSPLQSRAKGHASNTVAVTSATVPLVKCGGAGAQTTAAK